MQVDWHVGSQEAEMPAMVQQWIAEVVQNGFEAGNKQSIQRAEVAVLDRDHRVPELAEQGSGRSSDSSASPSDTDDSLSMGEDQWEQEFPLKKKACGQPSPPSRGC